MDDLRRAALFDKDGVLGDTCHRAHFLGVGSQGLGVGSGTSPQPLPNHPLKREGKADWDGFFAAAGGDSRIWPGVELLQTFRDAGLKIVVVTGHSEVFGGVCADWLEENGCWPDALIMRAAEDRRSSVEYKRSALRRLRDQGYDIRFAVDDDAGVCAMYREEGVCAIHFTGYEDAGTKAADRELSGVAGG